MDTHKIEETLDRLDALYNENTSKQEIDNFQLSIYCKIATLEFCGWIEDTHDKLVRDYLSNNIDKKNSIEEFGKKYIDRVNGLSYTDHLRPLLINLLGFIMVIKMESELDNDIQRLSSTLGELHNYRNYLAHNQYINHSDKNPVNNQKNIDTPSIIKNKFKIVLKGLEKIENFIRNINIPN